MTMMKLANRSLYPLRLPFLLTNRNTSTTTVNHIRASCSAHANANARSLADHHARTIPTLSSASSLNQQKRIATDHGSFDHAGIWKTHISVHAHAHAHAHDGFLLDAFKLDGRKPEWDYALDQASSRPPRDHLLTTSSISRSMPMPIAMPIAIAMKMPRSMRSRTVQTQSRSLTTDSELPSSPPLPQQTQDSELLHEIVDDQQTLIQDYLKQGQLLKAHQVLEFMHSHAHSHSHSPNNHNNHYHNTTGGTHMMQQATCTPTLQSHTTHDNPRSLQEHAYPDSKTYSSVLHAWLDQDTDNTDNDALYTACDRASIVLCRWIDAYSATKTDFLLSPPDTLLDYNAVLRAWSNIAHLKGVPQRAQHVLDLLQIHGSPTIDSYNYVLHTWAHSQEHLRATLAQILMDSFVQKNLLIPDGIKPNGTTYRTMIAAWVQSNEVKAAFRATGHLMKLLRLLETTITTNPNKKNMDDLQPTMEDYYSIFQAWTTARDKHAAEKSRSALLLMEYAYTNRFSELRADLKILRWILQAYARSDASPELLGSHVDELMAKIWDRHLVPDTICFQSAIQTFMNCALHKDLNNKVHAWPLAQRAHQILREMLKAVQQTDSVQVTTEHYNMVLKALTATDHADASHYALQLLDEMEQSSSSSSGVTNTERLPNSSTYALVMTTCAKADLKSMDRVKVAQELLVRAKTEYKKGNKTAQPTIFLYNALLQACAASCGPSDTANEQNFRLALKTVQHDIRNKNKQKNDDTAMLKPDSDTFYWLLEAAVNLLPSTGTMRSKAMEQIFNAACQEGVLDQTLLTQFRMVVPYDLFTKIVVDVAQVEDDGTRIVPQSWTRNVTTTGLVVNRKKASALTVQGEFFTTSQMKDRRMKRLQSRVTQKLLQGGRWQSKKDVTEGITHL